MIGMTWALHKALDRLSDVGTAVGVNPADTIDMLVKQVDGVSIGEFSGENMGKLGNCSAGAISLSIGHLFPPDRESGLHPARYPQHYSQIFSEL